MDDRRIDIEWPAGTLMIEPGSCDQASFVSKPGTVIFTVVGSVISGENCTCAKENEDVPILQVRSTYKFVNKSLQKHEYIIMKGSNGSNTAFFHGLFEEKSRKIQQFCRKNSY